MSIKRGLYAFLSAEAGIAAIAGDRIWPEVIPDQVFDTASKRPCLVYRRNSAARSVTFCRTVGLIASTFDIDCYAKTYDGAEQLAAAVRSALTDYTGMMGSVPVNRVFLDQDFDLLDIEPGLFRVVLTFTIWHDESL